MKKISYSNIRLFGLLSLIALSLLACEKKFEILTKDYEPKTVTITPGGGISIEINVSSDAVGIIPAGFWSHIPEATSEFESIIDPLVWNTARSGGNAMPPVLYTKSNSLAVQGFLRQRTNILVNDVTSVSDLNNDIWLGAGTISPFATIIESGYYCEIAMRASGISMASMFELTDGTDTKISFQLIGAPTETSMAAYNKKMVVTAGGSTTEVEMDSISSEGFQVYGVWWKNANTVSFYIDGVLQEEVTATEALSGPLNLVVSSKYMPEMGLPSVDQINDLGQSMMYTDWIRTYKPEETIDSTNVNNASFETADFTDWNTTGEVETSLYTSAVGSGAYAALLKGNSSISQVVDVEEGVSHLFEFTGFAASGSGSITIDGAEDVIIDGDPDNTTISFSAPASTVTLTISSSGDNALVYVDQLIILKEKPILIEGITEGEGLVINDSLLLTLNEVDTMWASPDFGAAFVGWYDPLTNELVSDDDDDISFFENALIYKLVNAEERSFIARFVDASTLPEPENLLANCDPGFEERDSIRDLDQIGWYGENEITTDPAWVIDGSKSYYHESGNLEVRYGLLAGRGNLTVGTAYAFCFDYICETEKGGSMNYAWPTHAIRDFTFGPGNGDRAVIPFLWTQSEEGGTMDTYRLFALWGQDALSMDNLALQEANLMTINIVGDGTIEGNEYPVGFGMDAAITAVDGANSFDRWEVNGETISTDATLTFTAYTSYTITAVFE